MQSFLLISSDKTLRESKAHELCLQEGIDPYDITRIERQGDEKKKAALGIDDVKHMQAKLYLKPFKGEKKAVMIVDAELLTLEAQNSLLKVLEEPPNNTYLFLTAASDETILPTILSRCSILSFATPHESIADEEREALTQLLGERIDIGLALKTAEHNASDKGKAVDFLTKLLLVARETLLEAAEVGNKPRSEYLVAFIRRTQEARLRISTTNVTVRLTLEVLLLS